MYREHGLLLSVFVDEMKMTGQSRSDVEKIDETS